MPGELGDEQEQPMPGYYEHLYVPTGTWEMDSAGAVQSWKEERKHKHPMIQRILRRLRKMKEKENANAEREEE